MISSILLGCNFGGKIKLPVLIFMGFLSIVMLIHLLISLDFSANLMAEIEALVHRHQNKLSVSV